MPECPNCEKRLRGTRCRACGWRVRPELEPPRPVLERPRDETPEERAQRKANLAKLYALIDALSSALPGPPSTRSGGRPRVVPVTIDPSIRAEVERRAEKGYAT